MVLHISSHQPVSLRCKRLSNAGFKEQWSHQSLDCGPLVVHEVRTERITKKYCKGYWYRSEFFWQTYTVGSTNEFIKVKDKQGLHCKRRRIQIWNGGSQDKLCGARFQLKVTEQTHNKVYVCIS